MKKNLCESCYSRPGRAVCVDENYEGYLCASCRKACEAEGMTVEVLR